MKIVFELYGEPQVSFTSHPYQEGSAEPPKWSGMRVGGVICDCVQATDKQPFHEGDVFHLEGDLKSVRSALQDVLDQLIMLESIEMERFEKRKARTFQCSVCQRWVDSRYQDEGHGDGLGNTRTGTV